jgi:hypothetical protein
MFLVLYGNVNLFKSMNFKCSSGSCKFLLRRSVKTGFITCTCLYLPITACHTLNSHNLSLSVARTADISVFCNHTCQDMSGAEQILQTLSCLVRTHVV